jgi:hypothetical protein
MEISVQIQLFMDDSVSPPLYSVETSGTYDVTIADYIANGHAFSGTTDSNGDYPLELKISESTPGASPVMHQIDLGQLASTGDSCGILVDLTLNGVSMIEGGKGHVRLSTADLSTKPIVQAQG